MREDKHYLVFLNGQECPIFVTARDRKDLIMKLKEDKLYKKVKRVQTFSNEVSFTYKRVEVKIGVNNGTR